MNRNRSQKRDSKQSTISSISSYIPLMATDKSDNNSFLTQSLSMMSTAPDLHNFLHSYPMQSTRDLKRSRTVSQPKGTICYTVGSTDTLEKVALQFNLTPSELLQLNKLNMRTVFPGQILFVPEECPPNNADPKQPTPITSSFSPPPPAPTPLPKTKDGDAFVLLTDRRLSNDSTPSALSPSRHQQPLQQDVGPMVWSMARQKVARPGRVQRLNSDPSPESEPLSGTFEDHSKARTDDNSNPVRSIRSSSSVEENHQLDEECLQRFIKVNVRLMTEDHQGVAGTLLVTPNAVMFDPDVLDPLVKEHGVIKYGLIIRMNLLAGIALYDDLTMFEHEATSRDEEKRKMCHSISVKHAQHSCTNTPLRSDEEEIHALMSSLLDKLDKELNPSPSTDTCCMLFNAATSTLQRHISTNASDDNDNNDTIFSTGTNDSLSDDSLHLSNDLFQPLDEYKHSIGILLDDQDDVTNVNKNFNRVPSQVSYVFDWKRFRRAVRIKKGCHLENCVPPDEFNKRFGEIDKLLHQQQQTYCAPHRIEIPYYLCIKTSAHTYRIPSLDARPQKKNNEKTNDDMYERKQPEQEYWFSVPKEKIDQLYTFFLRWTPEHEFNAFIDDDDDRQSSHTEQSKPTEKPTNKGFVLLANDDASLADDYFVSKKQRKKNKQSHYLQRQNTLLKEWEIISVDEVYRRYNSTHADDSGFLAPKLLQPSTLIDERQSKQILLELPPRLQGLDWYMVFSTETHGFSLNRLYRQSLELDRDMPSLLIVKDLEQNVFGAFVPHQLRISEGFYGTGESFLFTLIPEFEVYNWSGLNEFFVKGDLNAIGFGIGEGTYGLWLDGSLYRGRTCASKTFNNEQLSSHEDFIIASIELWTFVN